MHIYNTEIYSKDVFDRWWVIWMRISGIEIRRREVAWGRFLCPVIFIF